MNCKNCGKPYDKHGKGIQFIDTEGGVQRSVTLAKKVRCVPSNGYCPDEPHLHCVKNGWAVETIWEEGETKEMSTVDPVRDTTVVEREVITNITHIVFYGGKKVITTRSDGTVAEAVTPPNQTAFVFAGDDPNDAIKKVFNNSATSPGSELEIFVAKVDAPVRVSVPVNIVKVS